MITMSTFSQYVFLYFGILVFTAMPKVYGQICTKPVTLGRNSSYTLPGKLTPGTIIVIRGKVNVPIFSINIRPDLEHTIGLHISVRINQGLVAFNSGTNDTYDEEIRALLPDLKDNFFKFEIVCGNHNYEVSLNEVYLLSFPYRHPLADMKYFHNYPNIDQNYTIAFPRQKPCTFISTRGSSHGPQNTIPTRTPVIQWNK